ncbi:MAG: protein-disulfide reductase DsbD [Candidatus Aminicenantes bacterium]|nr:protein-disulfide reductase DsbD [Candidatus Aminicenantes bacterium]
MKRLWSILLWLPVLGLFASGQVQQNQEIVVVEIVPAAETFKAGQTYPLTLEVNIRAPYHINSDQPLESFLIGTTVDFKTQPGVSYKKVTFPAAEVKKLELSENPLSIYEGTVRITAEVVLAPDFKGKELKIEGSLGYQACDDRSCLPPAEVTFSRTVAVMRGAEEAAADQKEPVPPPPAGETRKSAAGEQKPQDKTPVDLTDIQKQKAADIAAGAAAPGKEAGSFENKGLFLTFILVFLGGLALNLTPCIYPLIPITISYFGGQGQGKKGSIVLHSILYVVGMATTYSILGVVAAITGSLFGVALQYPPVLVGIALIMFLLALSMFNVYELRVPAFLNKFAGGSQKGFFGTFFMGLTCGIIAAPCIGPFVLGLLTYVGNRGNVVLGFSLFFVLALGLGIPFLLLGVFSGSLNRIPRSGAWMVWVRTIFGFILIAMAIYFLETLFPNALFYNLAQALTMLVAGIYMAWIEPTNTQGKAFPYVRNVFGVIFFALALNFAVTGIQDYLDEGIAARLQAVSAEKGGAVTGLGIQWQPYSEEKLLAAARDGNPVFIDFFTDWCIACKEMDKLTFTDPAVIAASRDFVMLRSNLTTDTDPVIKDLYKRYMVRGVPTYVFLGTDGKEIADVRLVGFEKKRDFVPRLKRALELGKK